MDWRGLLIPLVTVTSTITVTVLIVIDLGRRGGRRWEDGYWAGRREGFDHWYWEGYRAGKERRREE